MVSKEIHDGPTIGRHAQRATQQETILDSLGVTYRPFAPTTRKQAYQEIKRASSGTTWADFFEG